jgi:hypothetical protein
MADWGSFAQGLAGGIQNGQRMGLLAQQQQMERIKMDQARNEMNFNTQVAEKIKTLQESPEYQPTTTYGMDYSEEGANNPSTNTGVIGPKRDVMTDALPEMIKLAVANKLPNKAMELQNAALERAFKYVEFGKSIPFKPAAVKVMLQGLKPVSSMLGIDPAEIDKMLNENLSGNKQATSILSDLNGQLAMIGKTFKDAQADPQSAKMMDPTWLRSESTNAINSARLLLKEAMTEDPDKYLEGFKTTVEKQAEQYQKEHEELLKQNAPHVFASPEMGVIKVTPVAGEVTTLRKPSSPEKYDSTQRMVKGVIEDGLKERGIEREATWPEIMNGVSVFNANSKVLSREAMNQQIQIAGAKAESTAKGQQNAQKGLISPQAMESAYQYLKTSGDLPPEIGRMFRLPIAQSELVNYVAKRQEEEGISGIDRAVTRSLYKAQSSELSGVAKLHGTASVAMGAAQRHGKTILELAEKKNDTGIPAIDRWWRAGKNQIAGDTDVNNLDIAFHMYGTETARYLSSMTAGGQLAEGEAQKMRALLDGAKSPQQIVGGVQTIDRMMNEKNASFRASKARIKKELSQSGYDEKEVDAMLNGNNNPTTQPAPSGGVKIDPKKFKPAGR